MGLSRTFINIAAAPGYFPDSEGLELAAAVELMCEKNRQASAVLRTLAERGWLVEHDSDFSLAVTYREFEALEEADNAASALGADGHMMDWFPAGERDGDGEFETVEIGPQAL